MTGDTNMNRRRALGWLAGGGVAATALLSANAAQAADETIDLDKVPEKIKKAADRVVPGATWEAAIKFEEEGKPAFELDGIDQYKREVTVLVVAGGKVIEVETVMKDVAKVPQNVIDAVREKWKNFKVDEAHFIRHGDDLQGPKDGDRSYDLKGKVGADSDRFIQVEVTADGKIIESCVEIAMAKVPKAVTEALGRKRPNFTPDATYVIRQDSTIIGYEFNGKGAKGHEFRIFVSPDGTTVEVVE